jgi:hypothetical protein
MLNIQTKAITDIPPSRTKFVNPLSASVAYQKLKLQQNNINHKNPIIAQRLILQIP